MTRTYYGLGANRHSFHPLQEKYAGNAGRRVSKNICSLFYSEFIAVLWREFRQQYLRQREQRAQQEEAEPARLLD
jgi:hypothetical protein